MRALRGTPRRRQHRRSRICTYECTFCADCADGELAGACPNWRRRAGHPAPPDRLTRRQLPLVAVVVLGVVAGDDEVPAVHAVLAPVGDQVAGPEAARLVGPCHEVGGAPAVDADDGGRHQGAPEESVGPSSWSSSARWLLTARWLWRLAWFAWNWATPEAKSGSKMTARPWRSSLARASSMLSP